MATELIDWDGAYREEGIFVGPPPWNIGEPQPAFMRLINQGRIHGDVLDAGCGHAELSLMLAAKGHIVVGVDLSRARSTRPRQTRNPAASSMQRFCAPTSRL